MKDRNTTTFVSNGPSEVPTRLGSSRLVLPAAILLVVAMAGQAWGQPSEVTKLIASDAAAFDMFGTFVSISCDTAIVGAFSNDITGVGPDAGSAYIFQQDFGEPDAWDEVRRLTAGDAAQGDLFGAGVSISGDFAIVGATYDDDACPPGNPDCNSGSAYIFYRNQDGANQWGQVAKLTASDAALDDRFGLAVWISGDTAIVGARRDDDGCPPGNPNCQTGSAYVFVQPSGGWVNMTETAKLTAFDGAAGDQFGYSASISGDVAVVGAPLDNDDGSNSGSAYVFVKPPGGWVNMTETVKLTALDGEANDWFGTTVSISGDAVVVGSIFDDDACPPPSPVCDSGSAYVFVKPPAGWDSVPSPMHQTAKLTASDGASTDIFGTSVSIRGDTVIIGAYLDDNTVPGDPFCNSGSAYVFKKPGTSWMNMTENYRLTASDEACSHRFGNSVSIGGDVVVVAANADDPNGEDSGSAYIFDGVVPCPWDLDGDCNVGILDLLALLAAWGTNPGGPPDFDCDDDVGILDLLTLLANWGNCPCAEGPPPRSLDDELADAGLSQADWEAFKECMSTGTQAEQDNCLCWMQYYLDGCDGGTRQACSDHDPFTDCVGDLNGDCCVDKLDSQILLNQLGPCPAGPGACLGDLNGDCVVDKSDHRDLLSHFGACPGTQYCPSVPPGCGTTTTTRLEGAVTQMGFSDVPDYQANISAASEGEAFVCACVLQVLLEAQP